MMPVLKLYSGFVVHAYAFFMSAGFIAGSALAIARARRRGVEEDKLLSLLIAIWIGSLAGARAFFVWEAWAYYAASPLEIPMVWRGGLSFYGGLVGGLAAVVYGCRRVGLPLRETLDLLVPSLAIGHALGRVGCLFHGCCFGQVAAGPFAVTFADGLPRHPTQGYELVALLVLWVASLRRATEPHRPGALAGEYLIAYATLRFALEGLRDDMVGPVFAGLLRYQWVSVVIAIAGAGLLGSGRWTTASPTSSVAPTGWCASWARAAWARCTSRTSWLSGGTSRSSC
jgi:phosphatidylglycerol:prolipoprotein diacylglycerol transferase